MKSFRAVLSALVLVAVSAAGAVGAPPTLTLPAEIRGDAGDFVPVVAETTGQAVKFVALDPGLKVFPSAFLKDPKTTVVSGPKGRYRLLAYTGSADGPSEPAIVTIVLGAVPPPKDPPADPPVGAGGYYFLIVRADGPASPAFTQAMGDPAWNQLRMAGHRVKDKTKAEAAALGVTVAGGLPAVVTLRVDEATMTSVVVRPAVPLPTTSAEIAKLVDGLP